MDQFGIGQALFGVISIYFRSARRTGRTTNLVESVKTGDRVVFDNPNEARRVKHLCKLRNVEIETIVIDPKFPEKLFDQGPVLNDGRLIFDHSWLEKYYENVFLTAENRIDYFQREISGFGMAHIETKIKAENMMRWKI